MSHSITEVTGNGSVIWCLHYRPGTLIDVLFSGQGGPRVKHPNPKNTVKNPLILFQQTHQIPAGVLISLFLHEEQEAVIKMTIKERSPHMCQERFVLIWIGF